MHYPDWMFDNNNVYISFSILTNCKAQKQVSTRTQVLLVHEID